MEHQLALFFKIDKLTEIMDNCDLTDGSRKVFCDVFNITITTQGDEWYLCPAVVEVLDEQFNKNNILTKFDSNDEGILCGIYDASKDVFYNFTDKKSHITMFSNGKSFAHFNTAEDIKQEKYVDAYKRFIFNDKQAKNDKYVYNLSSWLVGDENDSCK